MAIDKDQINVKLKSVDQSVSKTREDFTVIQTEGVDSEGFTFTRTVRIPVTVAEDLTVGDTYQGDAIIMMEKRFMTTVTRIGEADVDSAGGIKSVGNEITGADEQIEGTSVGEITEQLQIDGKANPSTIQLAYSAGSLALNLDSAGAGIDSDFRNGLAPSATKTGGDADNPISDILQTLTGLGATKLEQPNSGIAAIGSGGLGGIETTITGAVEGQLSTVNTVKTAMNSLLTDSDIPQMAKVGNALTDIATGELNKIAGLVTPIAALQTRASDKALTSEDLVSNIKSFSGFDGLNALVTGAKNTLSSFPSIASFTDGFSSITQEVNQFKTSLDNKLNAVDLDVDRGLGQFGGFLQNVNETISGQARSKVQGLLGGGDFQYSQSNMNSILANVKESQATRNLKPVTKSVGDVIQKNTKVSPRIKKIVAKEKKKANDPQELQDKVIDEAKKEGIPEKQIETFKEEIKVIDQELRTLDTTIAGSVVLDASFLGKSDPIDVDASKWSGAKTKDDVFTYVASVEELNTEMMAIEREIDTVFIHATETTTDKNIGASEINSMQIALNNEFDGIGYHYVIRRDGRLQRGRPVNKKGDHTKTKNDTSIGLVLVGGLNCASSETNPTNFRSAQSFTIAQYNTLETFLQAFYRRYPGGSVFGHNDLDESELDPYFDVQDYVESVFGKINV